MREKLLLCAAVLVAFGASLGGAFQFDDFALLSDPAVASPSGWWESWRLEQTRPLTWFTFWMNHAAGGGYHAVNLGLHLAVVLLLFDFLCGVMTRRAAFTAAALFAVHPMLAEPVNYIFARGTLLAALISLLAVRDWFGDKAWRAVLWFAAGMLAKEECVALPVALTLLDLSRGRALRKAPLAAMLGVAAVLGLRVVWATSAIVGSQAGAQAGISPLAYLETQGVVLWRYARMLALPWGFSVDYEIARPGLWAAIAGWAAVAATVVLAGRWFRDLRGGAWYLAGLILLLPSSSIFPAADLAADRRLYLPMLAFAAGAGLLLARVPGRVITAMVAVLAGISIYYSLVWWSPEALWTNALEHAPHKARPRIQLARAASTPEAALRWLDSAPQDDAGVASETGRLLLTLGRPDEALAAFGRSLALDPGDARNLSNRGAALAALGQVEAARADFERALARERCLFDARLNLARMGVATNASGCRYTPDQSRMLDGR